MKRLFYFGSIVLFFLALLSFNIKPSRIYAEFESEAKYCILMEQKSKTILYSKNENEKLYPASMTKMMGMLLILEDINSNKVSWNDKVTCSSYAANMGGTQIYLEEGETMTLEDLFKSVAINSANDAIVCLGEYISSSIDSFVNRMNEKAKELDMVNTHFENATGFDDNNHYSSPRDMAILGCELLKYDQQILRFSSLKESYVRENSSSPFWLVNTNKLLNSYQGMDGLKTGFTNLAGYNLTATAKRNGVRLVSVVMHEDTIKLRSEHTTKLLDYGFSQLRCERIFSSNDIISQMEINSSLDNKINLIVKDNVDIILFKDEDIKSIKVETIIYNNEPPISKDEVIGKLKITTSKNFVYEFDLYSEIDISKPSFFDVLLRALKDFFF